MKKPSRNRELSRQHQEALKDAVAEPLKRLNIQVPQSLHARIKVYAAEQGMTIQDLVIGAVNEVMKK